MLRKRAFHSRYDDDDSRRSKIIPRVEKAMDAGHAHVVHARDSISHRCRGHSGLFRYRNVGGAGGNDRDRSVAEFGVVA